MYMHTSNGVIYLLVNVGRVISRIIASGNIICNLYITTKQLWSQTAQIEMLLPAFVSPVILIKLLSLTVTPFLLFFFFWQSFVL